MSKQLGKLPVSMVTHAASLKAPGLHRDFMGFPAMFYWSKKMVNQHLYFYSMNMLYPIYHYSPVIFPWKIPLHTITCLWRMPLDLIESFLLINGGLFFFLFSSLALRHLWLLWVCGFCGFTMFYLFVYLIKPYLILSYLTLSYLSNLSNLNYLSNLSIWSNLIYLIYSIYMI